ncbi:uncharacterized protein TNCV_2066031 [Trichonephila clavipes]|nr:uncharacterized protein TNCV_2066031 [Trichonephila clavipes]
MITIWKLALVQYMSRRRVRTPSSIEVCEESWRQKFVLHHGYVQCPGGRTLSCVRHMSSCLEPKYCPATGSEVCLVSDWNNSVHLQRYVKCPGGRYLSLVRGMSSALEAKLSCVRGMSRGLDAELCPETEICPVSEWKNSVMSQRYVLCPSGRTLSIVSGVSSVRVADICRSSGWKNSVHNQRYVKCPGGRYLSLVRGMSSALESKLSCVWGMSRGLDAVFCPESEVCPVSEWKNSVHLQRYVKCPGGRYLSLVRGMSSGLEAKLYLVSVGILRLYNAREVLKRRKQLIIPEKRRRYDFDQSRRVLLSSDLHSISVLMAQMETDTPDITNSYEERNRLSLEIEALDIVINRCTELVNFPDTDDNHEMKAILRASIDDTQRKKDTMKTARPVSPLPSEPVTVNNSFSDLEFENDKDQVAPEENNETVPPKPKPPPIHLKIKKNIRGQLKSIYQKFPDITNKSSGEFIKLITNDIEEYHALTKFLEEDKDFEFFTLKPKPIKPIKIVIKGLPIFTKTHEIQTDLEEEGFTIQNVSQLISKKLRPLSHFSKSPSPATPIIKKSSISKLLATCKLKLKVTSLEELPNVLTATISFTRQRTATSSQDV